MRITSCFNTYTDWTSQLIISSLCFILINFKIVNYFTKIFSYDDIRYFFYEKNILLYTSLYDYHNTNKKSFYAKAELIFLVQTISYISFC